MTLIVQKFGGTSVASPSVIATSARHAAEAYHRGEQVVVVVSAMAGVTDQLDAYVRELALAPDAREYDVVVSSGEQVSCGLMALALQNLGVPAASWLSWQVPLRSSSDFGASRIRSIDTQKLRTAMDQGQVPVVAGFQGVTDENHLTTFGRGGSDITAVALAASLRAHRCDLYKDVAGVLTADPRIVPGACLIPEMTCEEMLELASLGAEVLQPRAAELAISQNVCLRILSTFQAGPGTRLLSKENPMEKPVVRSIVCQKAQARLVITTQDEALCSSVLKILDRGHIDLDMLTALPVSGEGAFGVMLTISVKVVQQASSLLLAHLKDVKNHDIQVASHMAKVSIVGVGLRGHPQILQTLFETLAHKRIQILASTVSETRVSILIEEEYAELVVRLLHRAYQLEGETGNGKQLESA